MSADEFAEWRSGLAAASRLADGESSSVLPVAPVPAPERQPAFPKRQIVLVGLGTLTLLWGVWASHAIIGLEGSSPRLVKVELADLVREYVQGEARSGAPSDQITSETAGFLKALNEAVTTRAAKGEVVLLGNAVVGGDVPDITGAVRREVYARVPGPQSAAPPSASPQMQPLFDQNGAPGGNGK